MQAVALKDLYLAKSMKELQSKTKLDENIHMRSTKLLISAVGNMFQAAGISYFDKNEEKAYMHYMRIFEIVRMVQMRPDFNKNNKTHLQLLEYANIAIERAEILKESLSKRYFILPEAASREIKNNTIITELYKSRPKVVKETKEILPENPKGLEALSKHFREYFISGIPGDIKIRVKGKEFRAHKMVLSARSPVFRSMLELDMKEKNDDFIDITDCDPDSFKDFLLFLYDGNLDIVSPNNALSLYFTSDKYNIEDMKKQCVMCLAQNVYVDSVCDIIQLATIYDETDLLNTVTKFFIENASAIIKTPKWFSFMTENPTHANELILKMADNYKNYKKA